MASGKRISFFFFFFFFAPRRFLGGSTLFRSPTFSRREDVREIRGCADWLQSNLPATLKGCPLVVDGGSASVVERISVVIGFVTKGSKGAADAAAKTTPEPKRRKRPNRGNAPMQVVGQ